MSQTKKIRLKGGDTKPSRAQLELELQHHKEVAMRLTQQNEELLVTNQKLRDELFSFLDSLKKADIEQDKEVRVVAESVAKQNDMLHNKNLALMKEMAELRESHGIQVKQLELQLSQAESIALEEANQHMAQEYALLLSQSQSTKDNLTKQLDSTKLQNKDQEQQIVKLRKQVLSLQAQNIELQKSLVACLVEQNLLDHADDLPGLIRNLQRIQKESMVSIATQESSRRKKKRKERGSD